MLKQKLYDKKETPKMILDRLQTYKKDQTSKNQSLVIVIKIFKHQNLNQIQISENQENEFENIESDRKLIPDEQNADLAVNQKNSMFNKLSGTFMGNKLINSQKNKDDDVDSEQYVIVQQTFRCSQNSNLFDLKTKIVEFFKISKYEFHIFNDNGIMIPEHDYGL